LIRPELWEALYRLALLGATKHPVAINSSVFARSIGLSQQTASRRLIELEKLGLIKREVHRKGQIIMLTDKGHEELKSVYIELKRIFEEELGKLTVEGIVFTGLGEGAYYVSRDGYRRQFIAKLGFDPYPGTLNIRLSDAKSLKSREIIEQYRGIEIEGFSDGDRTYGPVRCFRATINGKVEGALVIAQRTHYGKDTMEFIAPVNVRRTLGLKDGDKVRAEIYLVS